MHGLPNCCSCLWWDWTSKLCPDKPHRENIGGPAWFEDAKMINTVVVRGNQSQLLFILQVYYEAVPFLERILHGLGYVHCLYELNGGDIVLSIYNPKPPVFDFILGGWPTLCMGHDT